MSQIITYSFCDDYIEKLSELLNDRYMSQGRSMERVALIFGGRRPTLFLNRALARLHKKSFRPPRYFTIDEFMSFVVKRNEPFVPGRDLNECFTLYSLARKFTPEILIKREAFARFLPWSREIINFIDHLDLENISNEKLKSVQDNARIGYPVPDDINRMLTQIVKLRTAFHAHMKESRAYTRGFQYLRAAQLSRQTPFDEFDEVYFCNFFYFHKTEETVVKSLVKKNKAQLIFQGDERKWPVLKRISSAFNTQLKEGDAPRQPKFDMKLYAGFDTHSQAGMVRELLKGVDNLDGTVIVVPNSQSAITLLSEIASIADEFNISMGYPLKRSSLYSLLNAIFRCQSSRDGELYYSRDYLKVLRHPIIKNLKVAADESATRVLVHKIEEALTSSSRSGVSGSIFIELEDILKQQDIFVSAQQTLENMGVNCQTRQLKEILKTIHQHAFNAWGATSRFDEFADTLEAFINFLVSNSFFAYYPLNLKIAARILQVKDELKNSLFCEEEFPADEVISIFESKIEREMVRFEGSPLKGLQVLGLLETRSLNFKNVIIIDTNEGVLPYLNIHRHFIPREVMISLNLDRLEMEEEIQRYQFMRLISSAENVHLIYQESRDKGKSRFVEELIWEKQKKRKRLDCVDVARPGFEVKPVKRQNIVHKTPEMVAFLQKHRYSASSINTYLESPIEFYYRYVLGLQEVDDGLDEPENREVGIFVHELLEETFKPFVGKKPKIDAAFKKRFHKKLNDRFSETLQRSMKGDAFLLKTLLDTRLERFLENEKNSLDRKIKKILFIEEKFEDQIILSCGKMNFVYKIDRVDEMPDGTVMLIDYKTGSADNMPKGIAALEEGELSRDIIRECVKSFQIPLYFFYLEKFFQDKDVNAAFYNIRACELKYFFNERMTIDRPRITSAFGRALDFIMCEILNPDIPFCDEEVFAEMSRHKL